MAQHRRTIAPSSNLARWANKPQAHGPTSTTPRAANNINWGNIATTWANIATRYAHNNNNDQQHRPTIRTSTHNDNNNNRSLQRQQQQQQRQQLDNVQTPNPTSTQPRPTNPQPTNSQQPQQLLLLFLFVLLLSLSLLLLMLSLLNTFLPPQLLLLLLFLVLLVSLHLLGLLAHQLGVKPLKAQTTIDLAVSLPGATVALLSAGAPGAAPHDDPPTACHPKRSRFTVFCALPIFSSFFGPCGSSWVIMGQDRPLRWANIGQASRSGQHSPQDGS